MTTARRSAPTLITGGAGFIGTNLADRLLSLGRPVLIFDNLSRAGVRENVRWLQQQHNRSLEIEVADIRDPEAVGRAGGRAGAGGRRAARGAGAAGRGGPGRD